ncbi:uncharacterized protein LOC132204636 [Neocloeon triangulifer]|uniref:uncharacterized protein LOC132204636 n=1 Tax=Neocloeon triangulifer TaxID=2078957 RepID=UPI00286EB8A8|nr:uncharacterized protein LOC132204636 [Neocloeon triangulifer]
MESDRNDRPLIDSVIEQVDDLQEGAVGGAQDESDMSLITNNFSNASVMTPTENNAIASNKRTRFYNMNNKNRGVALIFNHYKFDVYGLPKREGTDRDKTALVDAFKKHAFHVPNIEDDLCISDIEYTIKKEIVNADHSDSDCVAIAILSHGNEGDMVYAKDRKYSLSKLSDMLTADKCPALAGKPKLFFIQACKGEKKDEGRKISVDSFNQSSQSYFTIPCEADFFFAFSTVPGYVSHRRIGFGSWFIQELCFKLMEDDSHERSIFQLMTEVVGTVAIEYESSDKNHKQIPSFASRLTKDLIFGVKMNLNHDGNNLPLNETVNDQVEEMELEGAVGGAQDETDISFKQLKKIFTSRVPVNNQNDPTSIPVIKTKKEARFYNMNYKKRGVALIFNHNKFSETSGLEPRNGTDKDKAALEKAFKKHAFHVPDIGDDLRLSDIEYVINRDIVKADHTDSDCVAIAILTHGKEGDLLHAKDKKYSLIKLVEMLTAENCKSLAGKPKLFFIQACMGKKEDKGQKISTDSAGFGHKSYFTIPCEADFFFGYSTIPGYVAHRRGTGSWFIQELCAKLMEDDSHERSIFHLMTEVVGTVAIEYKSSEKKHKQIPSFTSRLTKDLIFGVKASEN